MGERGILREIITEDGLVRGRLYGAGLRRPQRGAIDVRKSFRHRDVDTLDEAITGGESGSLALRSGASDMVEGQVRPRMAVQH